MSNTEALRLRDLAVAIALAKGRQLVPDGPYVYEDPVIAISYRTSVTGEHVLSVHKRSFSELQVLCLTWRDDGDAVVVTHLTGSWQDRLKRLA